MSIEPLETAIALTEDFLRRVRGGEAEPHDLSQILIERAQLFTQFPSGPDFDQDFLAGIETLRTLDDEIRQWCRAAQADLTRQLVRLRRPTTPSFHAGRLVVESA